MRTSIVHWNRPVECLATVAALRSQDATLAITVVDNHSDRDALRSLQAGLPPGVELITLPENVGWGRAHNVVLRRWIGEETSPFCLVSAHDALPEADCVRRLVDALASHADWGMACP